MTRLAVFDCDGTLVDGQAEVCDAMDRAFAAAALAPPDRNATRRMVGLSLPVAVRKLAPDISDRQAGDVVDAYKSAFRSRRLDGDLREPLYEGIESLLRALRADGWQLAVATGKSDRGLISCLETHGIRDLFVSLQTADRHPSKPHPAMLEAALFEAGANAQDSVMIGDTSFDMAMAVNAGVRALGVAWGYHEHGELIEAGADRVCATPADLGEALR